MKMFKNVLVLTVITLISGFLLGYVYDITKEPIRKAEQEAVNNALKAVFPEAGDFESIEDNLIVKANSVLESNSFEADSIDKCYLAKDSSGNIIGTVASVVSKEGYGGNINIIVGVMNDGTINGVEILSISETPGLGMKANTPEFKNQFKGKNVSSISYTKTGAEKDYEIDALSGATITTNAMTNAVNAGLLVANSIDDITGINIKNGGEE